MRDLAKVEIPGSIPGERSKFCEFCGVGIVAVP